MGKVAHPLSRSDKETLSPDKTASILDEDPDQLPKKNWEPLGILLPKKNFQIDAVHKNGHMIAGAVATAPTDRPLLFI